MAIWLPEKAKPHRPDAKGFNKGKVQIIKVRRNCGIPIKGGSDLCKRYYAKERLDQDRATRAEEWS